MKNYDVAELSVLYFNSSVYFCDHINQLSDANAEPPDRSHVPWKHEIRSDGSFRTIFFSFWVILGYGWLVCRWCQNGRCAPCLFMAPQLLYTT